MDNLYLEIIFKSLTPEMKKTMGINLDLYANNNSNHPLLTLLIGMLKKKNKVTVKNKVDYDLSKMIDDFLNKFVNDADDMSTHDLILMIRLLKFEKFTI